jgi:hypothetical protein
MPPQTTDLSDLVAAIYHYFDATPNDGSVIESAISFLDALASSNDLERIRPHLYSGCGVDLLNFRHLVFHELLNRDRSSSEASGLPSWYFRYVFAYGQFLLALARLTKDEDAYIQFELNYNDFIQELAIYPSARSILCALYDLRGLDFFLWHHMERETSALSDDALFNNASYLPPVLSLEGREEEAALVRKEIDDRRHRLTEIGKKFSSLNEERSVEAIDFLRIRAERFWNDYFRSEVWARLTADSRAELVDAFVAEYFLKKGVLRNWSQVILSLCKVFERELALTLFFPHIAEIRCATFCEPSNTIKSEHKRIQSRRFTVDALQKCAAEPVHSPTLGQLVFMARFFEDPVMDSCTGLFWDIRKKICSIQPDYPDRLRTLIRCIEEKHQTEREGPDLTELRNASAHPGRESDYEWKEHAEWLKKLLGKPPKRLLHLTTVSLREYAQKEGRQ